MKGASGANAKDVDWRAIYQRYTGLEQNWSVRDAPEPVARQFFRAIVHGHRTEPAILREVRSFGLEPPAPDLLREAFFLQSTLYPSNLDGPDRPPRPDGRHPDDPMEDVYAAALSMLPHGFWVESPARDQLYRGQRNARWPTIPKLFRSEDVRGELGKLSEAMPRIHACLPALSDEQAVATAQHYAKELGVSTWMLDMTYDPRVALFFASDGAVAGDIGAVSCVVQKEWQKLSANGRNRLGQLRVIDVPGVLRIENQRASFLDTSHPELFDQYVAHTVWFRQKDESGSRIPMPHFQSQETRSTPPWIPSSKHLAALRPLRQAFCASDRPAMPKSRSKAGSTSKLRSRGVDRSASRSTRTTRTR